MITPATTPTAISTGIVGAALKRYPDSNASAEMATTTAMPRFMIIGSAISKSKMPRGMARQLTRVMVPPARQSISRHVVGSRRTLATRSTRTMRAMTEVGSKNWVRTRTMVAPPPNPVKPRMTPATRATAAAIRNDSTSARFSGGMTGGPGEGKERAGAEYPPPCVAPSMTPGPAFSALDPLA